MFSIALNFSIRKHKFSEVDDLQKLIDSVLGLVNTCQGFS
jgi:hypothetical protein